MPALNQDRVPATIKEAVEVLYVALAADEIKYIGEAPAASIHHTAGMAVRNDWSLWEKETPLKRDAVDTYKIAHADDLSALIMDWLWARVREEAFDPVEYCKRFDAHWNQFGMSALQSGGYHDDGRPMTEQEQREFYQDRKE